MQTLKFNSTEEIQERISILEDQGVIDSDHIEVRYGQLGDEYVDVISEARIEREGILDILYINESFDDEMSDIRSFTDTARHAGGYWRE